MREDCSTDELIDVINGNRKYVRCLYVYNKIDMIPLEDVETLARQPDSIVISVRQKLNLDYLLARMWDAMGLVRVYCKKRGCPPDLDEPVVLSAQRTSVVVHIKAKRPHHLFSVHDFVTSGGHCKPPMSGIRPTRIPVRTP